MKILIIYSNFYLKISKNLLIGAESFLKSKKINFEKISVDGTLEIPIILSKFKDDYDGFILLGCVIKGETDHYNVVKDVALNQVYEISCKFTLAVATGILTVSNFDQAIERSDPSKKNVGGHAAKVCLNLLKILNE